MPIDCTDTEERLARIEQMIEEYRVATERQLLQRAMKAWHDAEARQQLEEFEARPELVH